MINNNLLVYEGYKEDKKTVSKNEIFTPREHKYNGSGLENKYVNTPDIPLAVLSGKLSPEECNNRRLKNGNLEHMTIEPLNLDKGSNDYGQAINYPALIPSNSIAYRIALIASREGDPRVELEND